MQENISLSKLWRNAGGLEGTGKSFKEFCTEYNQSKQKDGTEFKNFVSDTPAQTIEELRKNDIPMNITDVPLSTLPATQPAVADTDNRKEFVLLAVLGIAAGMVAVVCIRKMLNK